MNQHAQANLDRAKNELADAFLLVENTKQQQIEKYWRISRAAESVSHSAMLAFHHLKADESGNVKL